MHPRLTIALLVAVLGCRDQPTPEPASASAPATASASETGDRQLAPAPLDGDPFEGDPFEGVGALRPEPWTGWPLENVDIEVESGWRIDPVSGEFVLEQGLIFAAEPGAFVLAIAPGEVVELDGDPSDGAIELVLDHGNGIESRYAPLGDALVHAGLPVARGAAIGLARDRTLRLSVTVDGVAIDPLLVLRQPLHRWPALLRELPAPSAAEPG